MTDRTDSMGLAPDSALEDPGNDQFGYQGFSRHLADTIGDRVPSEEFVIGIYGQWGSGKTTILNFLSYYLENRDDSPIIIRFNPWWFSGQADLISKFFAQLESGLGDSRDFDNIRNNLSKFASGLSGLPLEVAGVPSGPLFEVLATALEAEPPDLDELKTEIEESLEELDQQIVVLIDDIDRLTNSEINQMFRLVKSVADFPNVTYVLAFDQEVVINALEEHQAVKNGEEYLEKIVQLPLHVPIPEEDSLHLFFTNELDEIKAGTNPAFDQDAWSSVYSNGIQPTIDTPRDAIRLLNAVNTVYTRLENEVNFVDLVAIETLRVFYRSIYEKIRDDPNRFISKPTIGSDSDDEFDDLWEEYDDYETEYAQCIVSYLFPRVSDSLTSFSTHVENGKESRQKKRIYDPEMFPYYFRQQVPRGEMTVEELQAILSLTDDPNTFAQRLRELSTEEGKESRSQAHNFLNRLGEFTDELSRDDVNTVITAFFLVGDELIQPDATQNSFDPGNRRLIAGGIFGLLDEIDESEKRFAILKQALETGDSIYLPAYLLTRLLKNHGEYGGTEQADELQILKYHQIDELKASFITSIEEAAEEGWLLSIPNLYLPLNRWMDWTDGRKPVEWAQRITEDDTTLIEFVGGFIRQAQSSGSIIDYVDPRWIEPFLDVSNVEDRFERLDKDDLDESEREIVDTFEKGLKYLQENRDPSAVGTWVFP